MSQRRRGWPVVRFVLPLVLVLGGCATPLPPRPERPPSLHLTDTADTRLGHALAAQQGAPGLSGVFPLSSPKDAFAARVLLVRAAERSLDIQYYIWHADTTGQLLFAELLRAADLGVRVRLLLDDNGVKDLDADLAALDEHPHIEVRLFNPFVQRRWKALGYLNDFERLNRRMHNKSFTADNLATIVGGRNIGDEYFGASSALEFADLDVLAFGPVAHDVSSAFDEYWNSASAYPTTTIIGTADALALSRLDQRLAQARASPDAAAYVASVAAATFVEDLLAGELQLQWVPVQLFHDPPAKVRGEVGDADLMLAVIARSVGDAEHEFELVSPYFVPGAVGTAMLVQRAANGVRVRVVTNSLAATDVVAVHAGYAKWREALLRGGVRLYEIKPDAAQPTVSRPSSLTFTGSVSASLHGKTFAIDRREIFVGSFNFDPRSVRLNSEMGLLISSPALAAALSETLDRVLSRSAYEVRLGPDGSLEWIETTASGVVRYDVEPQASLARRLGAALASMLPLESLL